MATATEPRTQANDPWMMEVPAPGGGSEYVLCPAGNYPGAIVALFDVGHHTDKAQDGTLREVRKLVLLYELVKKRPDGKPFLLAERYTWSMSEKANFYRLASNITGHKFREGEKFDPRSLLGVPVMVNVTHTEGTDRAGESKTYHNIGGVSAFPEGFTPPTPTRKPVSWSVLGRDPFPADLDLPFVYGKPILSLAKESSEGQARLRAAGNPADNGDDSIPF